MRPPRSPSRPLNRGRNTTRSSSPLGRQSPVNTPLAPGDPLLSPPSQTEITPQGKKRKFTAPVWEHYIIHPPNLYADGIARAIYKYCNGGPTIASSSNGTSNFIRHTESCSKRSTLSSNQLGNDGSPTRKMSSFVYKERIALATLEHAYPFTFAEHRGNRRLHASLNDTYKPISRNTLKNLCMRIHKREKIILKESMSELPGKICLTTDMWSAIVNMGYLSLTAHYIDSEWNLHSKILNFCHLEPPHDAPSLHDKILSLLKEWDIQKKIFTITLDNARCNDNMQDLLLDSLSLHSPVPCNGDFFHVRCGAHVLNLIVRDGLKVIDEGLCKLRSVIAFVISSERRKIKFKENALALGVDCSKKLCTDCPTRWNACYKMVLRASPYRHVFPTMRRPEMLRLDPHFPEPPSEEEWTRIDQICELLKPFDQITTLMSGRKYPTANLYFKCVWRIQFLLTNYAKSNDEHLRDMATRMRIKFDKYWENYSMILSFAAILYPRYKLPFIKYCFNELEPETAEWKCNFIKEKLYDLYADYERKSPQRVMRNAVRTTQDDFPGFASFDGGVAIGGRNSLDLYLDDTRLEHTLDIDILMWWKENGVKFPIVAEMARDILAIPITTVASESAFSMGSRVITKWRSSLHPDTAEALLTTRSWLFGFEFQEGEDERQDIDGLEFDLSNMTVRTSDEDEDEDQDEYEYSEYEEDEVTS